MDAPDTTIHGQNTTITGRLYVAFELGDKSWKGPPQKTGRVEM